MRVAFLAQEVPNTGHSTVGYSGLLFVRTFRDAGYDVTAVLLLPERSDAEERARRRDHLAGLGKLNVEIEIVEYAPGELEARPRLPGRLGQLRRILWPRIADFFPHMALRARVAAVFERIKPDVVFHWSSYEVVAATYRIAKPPSFLLTGDPPHMPTLARLRPPISPRRSAFAPRTLWRRGLAHAQARATIRLLSDCTVVAAGAGHYAEWFRRHGLPDCRHMYAVVPDWGGPSWREALAHRRHEPRFRIVMMGHVTGTATLAGIIFFAESVLPVLTRELGEGFEVHICGKGEIPADLRARLERPNIFFRGFVEDIVAEIVESEVLLVPTPIDLGIRIRIAYAWSAGACVVAHEANAAGLPALRHGENALLAGDGEGLARQIIRACADPDLRQRLSLGGRRTFEAEFSSEAAGGKVLRLLEELAAVKGETVSERRF